VDFDSLIDSDFGFLLTGDVHVLSSYIAHDPYSQTIVLHQHIQCLQENDDPHHGLGHESVHIPFKPKKDE
jgi:hypothetical protein